MKKRIKILVLFLITFNFFSAQENQWKKLENSFSQKTIRENGNVTIKNTDSLILEIYRFQQNEKIDLTDLTKLQMIPTKTSFADLKLEVGISVFNPELKINSEYQIKYETPENKTYKYSLYLFDNITENQIKDLNEYVKKNFKIDRIKFISKEEAMKNASETLGINSQDLFEGNIFPASIEIESNEQINYKKVQNKYPKLVEDIRTNDSDLGVLIMKIKT